MWEEDFIVSRLFEVEKRIVRGFIEKRHIGYHDVAFLSINKSQTGQIVSISGNAVGHVKIREVLACRMDHSKSGYGVSTGRKNKEKLKHAVGRVSAQA